MRIILILSLLLTCIAPWQNGGSGGEGSLVVVVDYKYLKSRQTTRKPNPASTAPAADMSTVIKNNQRYQ
ncbi:MAG TPA: hypothetical protein VJT09_07440, partial [Pyrinomonadaceae bacterium]|nr:hypothetical protein [Pyrinomonadaceae bacterium]